MRIFELWKFVGVEGLASRRADVTPVAVTKEQLQVDIGVTLGTKREGAEDRHEKFWGQIDAEQKQSRAERGSPKDNRLLFISHGASHFEGWTDHGGV